MTRRPAGDCSVVPAYQALPRGRPRARREPGTRDHELLHRRRRQPHAHRFVRQGRRSPHSYESAADGRISEYPFRYDGQDAANPGPRTRRVARRAHRYYWDLVNAYDAHGNNNKVHRITKHDRDAVAVIIAGPAGARPAHMAGRRRVGVAGCQKVGNSPSPGPFPAKHRTYVH